MTHDQKLAKLARDAGIVHKFTDMQGVVRRTSPDTQRALLAANGYPAGSEAEVDAALAEINEEKARAVLPKDVIVPARKGRKLKLAHPSEWVVLAENTNAVLSEGFAENELDLPPLPDGVHQLQLKTPMGEQEVNLIVAPQRAPSVAAVAGQEKIWGCMAALYGLRSTSGKSVGDFEDLGVLARELGALGAGFLGINPVHALGCAAEGTISPYSPTHRGFLNTDHIGVATTPAPDLDPACDLIDYERHRAVHRNAMKRAFAAFQTEQDRSELSAFDRFCAEGGARLNAFALFEHLSIAHGSDWRSWPAALRSVEKAYASVDPDSLIYHKWLQWRADEQLSGAQNAAQTSGMPLGLYLDLAVGARVGGAESWGQEAATAPGVSLGAPPDHLSPAGQNWQLSALAPRKLQASGYDAFRHVLRQNLRHCGLLRIDHALGLSRSFWILEDGSPGGYVSQPFQSLLAIVALEAQRAGTVVIGEDLGLVPAGFRDEMARFGFYGYSVMQYEKGEHGALLPASNLRPQSLACFGTHDTPTLAGFWSGRDIAWWKKLGWIDAQEAARAVDTRTTEKRVLAGIAPPTPLPQKATLGLRDTVHATLATSPAALVAVQLDDVLLCEEAQNLPGTIDEHPNWRRRYRSTMNELAKSRSLEKTAAIMAKAGRAGQLRKVET